MYFKLSKSLSQDVILDNLLLSSVDGLELVIHFNEECLFFPWLECFFPGSLDLLHHNWAEVDFLQF